jgi:hypothetical protein
MTLEELIDCLEQANSDMFVPMGFGHPHSYRGYYDQLAFEPVRNTTAGEMLVAARSALNKVFEGYKGGDFKMTGGTDCWLSEYGRSSGETIGPVLLAYMLRHNWSADQE